MSGRVAKYRGEKALLEIAFFLLLPPPSSSSSCSPVRHLRKARDSDPWAKSGLFSRQEPWSYFSLLFFRSENFFCDENALISRSRVGPEASQARRTTGQRQGVFLLVPCCRGERKRKRDTLDLLGERQRRGGGGEGGSSIAAYGGGGSTVLCR